MKHSSYSLLAKSLQNIKWGVGDGVHLRCTPVPVRLLSNHSNALVFSDLTSAVTNLGYSFIRVSPRTAASFRSPHRGGDTIVVGGADVGGAVAGGEVVGGCVTGGPVGGIVGGVGGT